MSPAPARGSSICPVLTGYVRGMTRYVWCWLGMSGVPKIFRSKTKIEVKFVGIRYDRVWGRTKFVKLVALEKKSKKGELEFSSELLEQQQLCSNLVKLSTKSILLAHKHVRHKHVRSLNFSTNFSKHMLTNFETRFLEMHSAKLFQIFRGCLCVYDKSCDRTIFCIAFRRRRNEGLNN